MLEQLTARREVVNSVRSLLRLGGLDEGFFRKKNDPDARVYLLKRGCRVFLVYSDGTISVNPVYHRIQMDEDIEVLNPNDFAIRMWIRSD